VQQQQLTADKLEKMAAELEKSIEEMDKNNLLSEQIMEKLKELQKLFNEVATPEMKEALKKLAEALQQMSPDELKKAMEDFQLSRRICSTVWSAASSFSGECRFSRKWRPY